MKTACAVINYFLEDYMIITTKIIDEKGETKMNGLKNVDPTHFEFDYLNIPDIGDLILIQDGEANGEYIVERKIHIINKNTGHPLLLLKEEKFDNSIRMVIDN